MKWEQLQSITLVQECIKHKQRAAQRVELVINGIAERAEQQRQQPSVERPHQPIA